jgi:hypothetical protein
MSRWQWIAALIATAAVNLPSATLAQDWTSVSGAAAPNEATAAAEPDDEPRSGAQRYQMRENWCRSATTSGSRTIVASACSR